MRYFFANIHRFLPHLILCAFLLTTDWSWAAGVTGI